MLRMYLLANWFNLSDEGVEDAIYDSYAFRKFMRVDFLGEEQVPDATTLVLLDETTAYADPESEAQIQEAVSRLVHGKTLVVVAHRLSTIQNAQQILVVDRGRIVAKGTQAELLENCPLYRTMWEQHIGSADHTDEGRDAAC